MGDFDHLTDLAEDVRATYVVPPDEETESRHLAAMAEVARAHAEPELSKQPNPRRRSRARAFKGGLMIRTRIPALAALTLVAAFATGGLAAAGVISLPNPLPEQASDRAGAVHDEIQGSDPSEEHCAFGLSVAEAASNGHGSQPSSSDACDQENGADATEANTERGKSGEEHGKSEEGDVEAQGAEPDTDAGQAFGDSVSDRAEGGEPQNGGGRDFGDSVSDEAKDLVDTPEPQGAPETGDTNSQEGQANAETHAQGGPETGQEKAGEHTPDR